MRRRGTTHQLDHMAIARSLDNASGGACLKGILITRDVIKICDFVVQIFDKTYVHFLIHYIFNAFKTLSDVVLNYVLITASRLMKKLKKYRLHNQM
jgi:hypothetical protein